MNLIILQKNISMSHKSNLSELEEGEIDSNASLDDIYTPLERPVRNDTVPPPEMIESDIDENDDSTSDSDSSGEGVSKPKMKKMSKLNKPKLQKPNSDKLKIWCNVLEDESVANNLTDCNLDESQMRIRGYIPYPKSFNHADSFKGNPNSNAGKRNHAGQFVNERKRFKDHKYKHKKGAPKFIPPLSETAKNSNEFLAAEIAASLHEVKHDLISKSIEIAGRERIISVFEETRETEISGGMLVMNGSRRRTSGGVFFYLLKTSMEIPQEQLKEIFLTDKQNLAAQKKITTKQNSDSTTVTVTENENAESEFV